VSCIYGLYDPRVNSIRYVGKTRQTLKQRMAAHLSEGRRVLDGRSTTTTAVYCWIAKLLNEGVRPEIRLLEECTQSIEGYLEIEWIANMRLCGGPTMLNLTEGGDGCGILTEEMLAQRSESIRLSWQDPEIRARRMDNQPSTHEMSAGFSELRSEVQKRVWQDPEYHAKQTATRRARPPKTHCIHGHEYTPENTWISPSTGYRVCRTCNPNLASPK
jgi:hypothetical protein